MLDENGYRYNVGIIIINDRKQVFGQKERKDAWQFPQGGIKKGESIELAMYRELKEETGLEMPMLKFWVEQRPGITTTFQRI